MIQKLDDALRRGRIAGLVLAVLLAGGCSAEGEVLHLDGDHPAHPGAAKGPEPAAPAAPAEPAAPPAPAAPAEGKVYTCPMHPDVVSDAPGRCPKCHMNLVAKPRGGGGGK